MRIHGIITVGDDTIANARAIISTLKLSLDGRKYTNIGYFLNPYGPLTAKNWEQS